MKLKRSTHFSDSEHLFAQATEDITLFVKHVNEWKNSDDPSASISTLAAGFGRGTLALARLAETAPDADKKYVDQLSQIFHDAGGNFTSYSSVHKAALAASFAEDGYLWQVLRESERSLRSVREISRDGKFFENEKWLHDELIQTGSHFLLLFSELAWLARYPLPLLTSLTGYQAWQTQFNQVENLFCTWFGYFYPFQKILTKIRDREYGAAFWWLMTEPTQEMIVDQSFTDAQITGMGQLLKRAGMTPAPCPKQLVIALALGDPLTDNDRAQAINHKDQCLECNELYQNLQQDKNEGSAKDAGAPPPELLTIIHGQEESTLNYDSLAAFMEAMKSVPTWQLLPESADHLVSREDRPVTPHRVDLSIVSPETTRSIADTDSYLAVLQAAIISQPTLVGRANSVKGSKVLVRIARVIGNLVKDINIIELEDLDYVLQEGMLSITGALPLWLKLPKKIKWLCTWLCPNGTIVEPNKLQTAAHTFTVSFDTSECEDRNLSFPPDGELRVLLMAYVEES